MGGPKSNDKCADNREAQGDFTQTLEEWAVWPPRQSLEPCGFKEYEQGKGGVALRISRGGGALPATGVRLPASRTGREQLLLFEATRLVTRSVSRLVPGQSPG